MNNPKDEYMEALFNSYFRVITDMNRLDEIDKNSLAKDFQLYITILGCSEQYNKNDQKHLNEFKDKIKLFCEEEITDELLKSFTRQLVYGINTIN